MSGWHHGARHCALRTSVDELLLAVAEAVVADPAVAAQVVALLAGVAQLVEPLAAHPHDAHEQRLAAARLDPKVDIWPSRGHDGCMS